MNEQDQDSDSNDIDLGDQDEGPTIPGAEQQSPQRPVNYPTVMLHGGSELQRIADNGVHKIHAKVVSRHMPHGHNKKHRVELEIHKIRPQMRRGRKAKNNDEDSGAMRKAMEDTPE